MTKFKATNITWHRGHMMREERAAIFGQIGLTVWFTGLPSSGKSSVAMALEQTLCQRRHLAYTLDGDNVRHGLNKNLGFCAEDREENIRRIAEVAKLFADAGVIAITSFISPYAKDRAAARQLHQEAGLWFVECFVDVPWRSASSVIRRVCTKWPAPARSQGSRGLMILTSPRRTRSWSSRPARSPFLNAQHRCSTIWNRWAVPVRLRTRAETRLRDPIGPKARPG